MTECLLCIAVFMVILGLLTLNGLLSSNTDPDEDDLTDEIFLYDTFYDD